MSWTQFDQREMRIYEKYAGLSIPRHTSYPAVPFWKESWSAEQLGSILRETLTECSSLSLYFHIPFCEKLCFYCGCNKVIRPKEDRSARTRLEAFLNDLHREIEHKVKLLGPQMPPVKHLHFGGGTPTYLEQDDWLSLWDRLQSSFQIEPDAEIAIEVDPRTVDADELSFLRKLGFNRLSLGVQDFDPRVQKAINRIQDHAMVGDCVQEARKLGFQSINFDLIYGLPFQDLASLQRTLQQVIQLNPDRIAFYRLAVIPELFKWQRQFQAQDLPSGRESMRLFTEAIAQFHDADYQFIGLDHFAKTNDPLYRSFQNRTLSRNFQGMTAGLDRDVLAFGPSAISSLQNVFFQNMHDLREYKKIASSEQPSMRACKRSKRDVLKAASIESIYCFGEVEEPYSGYFFDEHPILRTLLEDGLIELAADGRLRESPRLGRLLRRVFATAFDDYVALDQLLQGADSFCGSSAG